MTPSNANSTGKTFLAIDMDAKLRRDVERYLKMDGARSVHTTDLPQHGIDILQSAGSQVDCIICALDLSPYTGIKVLKALRSGKYGDSPYLRGIQFIMLTAHREMDLLAAVKKLDVSGFIVKPIDFRSFLSRVHGALAHPIELRPSEHYAKVDIKKAMQLTVLLQNKTR